MPIYEYRCGNCRRRVSIFSRGFESDSSLACPQCNSTDLTRLFSSFRIGKGDTYYRKDFYEDILGDHQLVRGLESSDPKALAEWNRRMMNATGDDIAPEYEDFQGRLESGESYESVVSDAQATLLEAIRRLPEDRQELLVLKFVDQLTNAEIARIMGRTEGAIKSLYHRTLVSLRQGLVTKRTEQEQEDRSDGERQ